MNHKLLRHILLVGVITLFSFSITTSVFADGEDGNPATPETFDYVPSILEQEIGDILPFDMLGYKGGLLATGQNESSLGFSIPAHWQLVDGGKIVINIQKSIYDNQIQTNNAIGGWLKISLNNTVLDTIPVNINGAETIELNIPQEHLEKSGSRYSLNIDLVTSFGCGSTQSTTVSVLPNSYFVLPHQFALPSIDLRQLPQPIQQGSFLPDRAFMVVPNIPTATELQAALTLSAGFGRMMNRTEIQLIQYQDLTEEIRMAEHIIAVGKPEQFPLLSEVSFPLEIKADESLDATMLEENAESAQMSQLDETDGVLQIVNSPWNPAKVILFVSGISDAGTLKAAKAIGYGTIRTGDNLQLAIVNEVYFTSTSEPLQSNIRTFENLGYAIRTLNGPDLDSTSFTFFIPPGASIAEDEVATLNLLINHSSLIKFEQSGVNILLNGRPIYSIRLSEQTTDVHDILIEIPPMLIQAGDNTISVGAELEPMDECSDLREEGSWFNVYPESSIYLPLTQIDPIKALSTQISSYPQPFAFDESLDSTAFIFPTNNPTAWFTAVQIAFDLGKRVDGDLLNIQVAFADNLPETLKAEDHLFIIGQATELPFLPEINNHLPAPFAEASNRIDNDRLPVEYEIPVTIDLGYLQLFTSPWNGQRNILLISGDSELGIQNAISTLLNSRRSLNGDLAVIESDGLFVTASEPESEPEETAVSPDNEPPTGEPEDTAVAEVENKVVANAIEEETAVSENPPLDPTAKDNESDTVKENDNDETSNADETVVTSSNATQNILSRQGIILPIVVLSICIFILAGFGFRILKTRQ